MTNVFSELARFTAETFVAGLWKGLALIAAVALCLRLLSRISASVRFAIWSLTFALLIAIPLLHLHSPAAPSSRSASALFHISPIWAEAIAALWISLTAVRLALLLRQTLNLVAESGSAPVPLPHRKQLSRRCKAPAAALTSTYLPTLIRPASSAFSLLACLCLHRSSTSSLNSDLHQIVLHECEHLRRRDDWINLAQKFALALFPLNPALLFVDRRLSFERELACDAGVVARTAAPFDYAHCLTRLAEHSLHPRGLNLALSAWNRQSELVRRVHTLLKPIGKRSPVYATTSVAALLLVLIASTVELAHFPHLVSFAKSQAPALTSGVDTAYRSSASPVVPVLYDQTSSKLSCHAAESKTLPSAKASPVPIRRTIKQQHQTESVKPTQPRVMHTATPRADHQHRSSTVQAFYITTEFSPTYAAVPFGDGWLIVQL